MHMQVRSRIGCRYYRYTGIKLPSMYNAEFEMLLKTQSTTASGAKPLAIHFALDKPFDVGPDDYRWDYLCYRPKMVSLTLDQTVGGGGGGGVYSFNGGF